MISVKEESKEVHLNNTMKVLIEICEKVLKVCQTDPIVEDKVKEIFAMYRCAAITTKGDVCGFSPKDGGFCGKHSGKKLDICSYTRQDGSKCTIRRVENSLGCWIHKDITLPRPKKCKRIRKSLERFEECKVEEKQTPPEEQDYSVFMKLVQPLEFKEPTEFKCPAINDTGKNKGSVCGAELKLGKFFCTKHRTKNLQRQMEDVSVEYKCGAMDLLCATQFKKDRDKGCLTYSLKEEDISGDNDLVIDEGNALPKFKPKRCVFLNEEGQLCCEPVFNGSHMCKEHKKFAKQFEHNSGTNRYFDSFWPVKRVCLEPAFSIAPNYRWFPHLNFYAHMTKKGPIVVGKVFSMIFPESLEGFPVRRDLIYSEDGIGTDMEEKKLDSWMKKYCYDNDPIVNETSEDMIKRCHNNGLLYKVIPQEVLHKQYNLPSDLDKIDGFGFTSFEQMIRERPALYIKYWNVWLGHIRRAKDFTKFMGCNRETLKIYLNADEEINWEKYFKVVGPKIGLYHVEVPAPTLEDISQLDFNPFRYCRDWVQENLPEKINEPWFPPMYLLYPFPLEYYEDIFYHKNRLMIESIQSKELYAHYNKRPSIRNSIQSWMQWLKYGDHEGQFRLLYAFRVIENVYPDELKEAVEKALQLKEEFKTKYPKEYREIYNES